MGRRSTLAAKVDSDAFSLFDNEEAVLARTDDMLARLAEVAAGVRDLAEAYRRGYREQRQIVRMSDRMQSDLQRANQWLADQQRDLQMLNEALSTEIEHRKRLEAEMRRLAETDHLTGAFSRRRFTQHCEQELRRHGREGRPACLLMLDLDRFKKINDSYGHATGDAALVTFAQTCREALRGAHAFGRMGGEEFAILLEDMTAADGLAFAEDLRRAVAATPVESEEESLTISVSIGLAVSRSGESLGLLMRRADAALYAAKAGGRDRVCVAQDTGAPEEEP
ncbi:GGDEF domain-containing protein [Methylobacterium organophilum]|uniref:GGDEF domain-containing protein n=1 Tax=Methylobacterium organophilum TaxID=410 RepID=UPI001F137365|nr:GGDEF domain-containing protein [Methylobacterium organophilum]UMY17494.1 GGDEF domain-containing protein [Methylobacterium organophilum]